MKILRADSRRMQGNGFESEENGMGKGKHKKRKGKSREPETKPYRKNVGIVVFNAAGQALVGERLKIPGAFQYPQGGLDRGETPLEAARRELYEEIGLKIEDEPAGMLPARDEDWYYYDFPPDAPAKLRAYQGQKQKWYFFYWDGDPAELSLDHHEREFSRLEWTTPAKIAAEIVAFKRPVYERLRDGGEKIIAEYLAR